MKTQTYARGSKDIPIQQPAQQKEISFYAKKAREKQELMLKEMQERQMVYFTIQQNKFMKTTNQEGGILE